MSDIDQQRGKYAQDMILARFGEGVLIPGNRKGKGLGGVEIKKYRTVALGAGAYLRQSGLLQVAAFWYSKDKGAEQPLLKDVLGWLSQSDLTRKLCEARPDPTARGAIESSSLTAALSGLLERESDEVAVLEAECEAVLLWFKRLMEGLYKSLPE